MKKLNFWPGLLLFIALIGLAIFFNQKKKKAKHQTELTLKQVDKIELAQDNIHRVVLVNDDGVWLVNGIVPVRRPELDKMFDIIIRIRKKERVNEHILFDIRQELMNSPEVKIWSQGKIVKSFFIGPPVSDSSGNYYMPSDDMLAYVVTVPGFRGNLQNVFVPDLNYWRDSHVLAGILNKVKYVSFHEPGMSQKKDVLDPDLKKDLAAIQTTRYIDEAGLIDSLHWAFKHGKYLFRIEFYDKEKIPQSTLACFKRGNRFLLLFEDFGTNAVVVVLSRHDIDLLKRVKN